MFLRRKREWTDLAGGCSHRRYAVNAFATAGNRGSSIDTLVLGRRARSTLLRRQSRSSNRIAVEPRRRPDHTSPTATRSQNHACLELPFERIERRICCTSFQGKIRGGCSSVRYRGAITPLARSAYSLPVMCRNRRNARSELQVSATVRFESRVASVRTYASTFARVARAIDFVPRRSCPRKPHAVSTSRPSVLSETPLCARR